MLYKHIPEPVIEEKQVKKNIYKVEDDILIIGWEVGIWVEEDESEPAVYNKLYEVMALTPEQEEEWQRQQAEKAPSYNEKIEAQVLYTAIMTDTVIEEDTDE